MTTHMLLPASERPWKAWKNGGGEMAEIVISPAGSDEENFKWRIAIARIDADGPFSLFPGINRTFMIVGGKGVRLEVDGSEPVRITHKSPPFVFPGERATMAILIDGPTVALNVMARRGVVQTRVGLIDEPSQFVPGSEAYSVLVWARGRAEVEIEGQTMTLGTHDGVIFDAGVDVKVRPGDHAHGWLIEARTHMPIAAPTTATA